MFGCIENTFFDGRIDFLHHGEQVKPYFITGIFILQIGAVCYIVLSCAVQVINNFFAVQTKERAYDVLVLGAYSP